MVLMVPEEPRQRRGDVTPERRYDVDGNAQVGAHLANDLGGHRIGDPAIHEYPLTPADRCQQQRHRTAGAKRLVEPPARDDDAFP